MTVQVSYPGVYIDEFAPGAPIQGLGTSTAAFLGVCKYGPPNEPTRITSWDAFVNKFCDPNPKVKPEDDDYLWYGVRGFFQNGGKVCFVTAVSNAKPDYIKLKDENAKDTTLVKARKTGQNSPQITVDVTKASSVKEAKLFAPDAQVIAPSNADVKCLKIDSKIEKFVSGDKVIIGTGANQETRTIDRIDKSLCLMYFTVQLVNPHVSGEIINLVLDPFSKAFRAQDIDPVNGTLRNLVTGSIITLEQGGKKISTIVQDVSIQRLSNPITYLVTVKDGINGFDLYDSEIFLQSEEFTITVSRDTYNKSYNGLSMSPGHPRHFQTLINNDAAGIILANSVESPNISPIPKNRPAEGNYTLQDGEDFDLDKIYPSDYDNALAKLKEIKDINLVAVPGLTDKRIQCSVINHCENDMKDRFAILDSTSGLLPPYLSLETQKNGIESTKGFAAFYYPWLQVTSEKTKNIIPIPPSGHIAGIYARIDNNRGVHKAPAGLEATVSGALGVVTGMCDADHGILNMKGINVIRVFKSGGRPVVWGARTTSPSGDTTWQYVNIRRLFIFLEQSIEEGIRWAVFDPNNLALWQKLKRTITEFLTRVWRDGALFGDKAEDAFYVRIDEVLNPPDSRALGYLNMEIGIKPSYPAEFIVVKIGIWPGGSEVTES